MSGVKRRSKYRKHVRAALLDSLPEPEDGQQVAKVLQTKGRNVLEIVTGEGEEALCILPTKFRKMVWVKRGSFLIVSEANTGSKGAISFHTEHILYDDQIKHLKKRDMWPALFTDDTTESASKAPLRDDSAATTTGVAPGGDEGGATGGQDGTGATAGGVEEAKGGNVATPLGYETETESDADDDLFVNNNRFAPSYSTDDDAGDDSDDDSDDDY